jgi:diketogulonate reductase-like aldo/keto reductase
MPDYKNPLNNIVSWQAIEKLVEMGVVKTIGVSNYSMRHI